MKIHIVGGSGTGKSFVAERISERYHIPHYDLDDIFWDNSAASYGTKMPIKKRTEALGEILAGDNWVIEGVFYDWLNDSFCSADMIFILQTSPLVFNARILKRYLKRKLGWQRGKKETLKSLFDLLVWTNQYQRKSIPKIRAFLDEYKDKIVVAKKSQDILSHMDSTCKRNLHREEGLRF